MVNNPMSDTMLPAPEVVIVLSVIVIMVSAVTRLLAPEEVRNELVSATAPVTFTWLSAPAAFKSAPAVMVSVPFSCTVWPALAGVPIRKRPPIIVVVPLTVTVALLPGTSRLPPLMVSVPAVNAPGLSPVPGPVVVVPATPLPELMVKELIACVKSFRSNRPSLLTITVAVGRTWLLASSRAMAELATGGPPTMLVAAADVLDAGVVRSAARIGVNARVPAKLPVNVMSNTNGVYGSATTVAFPAPIEARPCKAP